jgi:hypothetical protein
MIEKGEIVFCNLKFRYKKKKYKLKEIVYKQTDGYFYNKRILQPLNVCEKVKVYDIEILSRLGFENKNKGHIKAIKNEEKRNKITGAYE